MTNATENTYLQVLSEMGIIGFGVFALILAIAFQLLLNGRRFFDPQLKRLAHYMLYGFITFLVLMLTNDFLYSLRVFWIWIWVIMGLSTLDNNIKRQAKQSEEGRVL